MENRMLLWKEYIERNLNSPINVDLEILRVSIISLSGESISEYFTFESKTRLLEFIKEVILSSIVLSIFFQDTKNPSIYLWTKEEVSEFLDTNAGLLYKNIFSIYKESYNYLDKLEYHNIKAKDILDVVDYLEKKFDIYNLVFLNLTYGETTDDYLKGMIEQYKSKGILDILEKELDDVKLKMEKINAIINNIYGYEECIREEILDKLLYGK